MHCELENGTPNSPVANPGKYVAQRITVVVHYEHACTDTVSTLHLSSNYSVLLMAIHNKIVGPGIWAKGAMVVVVHDEHACRELYQVPCLNLINRFHLVCWNHSCTPNKNLGQEFSNYHWQRCIVVSCNPNKTQSRVLD